MSPITLSMFLGLYVAIAPLPHNAKQPFTKLEHQPSEQQNHIQDRDNRIAQSNFSSTCEYVRQAFKASGIMITDENTIARLVSGERITVGDPNRLYTHLSGHQKPIFVGANENLQDGAFWIDLNQRHALAQPNPQNISLKSNEKFVAQGEDYFAIFLQAEGHTCMFWIGWNGIERGGY
ncbi:hypothetical protein [Nostoc sp.]|uniref:hypothetical protein n=1 Tax=Nostoc sp. TaxID=1180 RepID=UPI002FF61F65